MRTLARNPDWRLAALLLVATSVVSGLAGAQTLYKYRGENGEWIYTDRAPGDEIESETRSLRGRVATGEFLVSHELTGNGLTFTAVNSYHAPMQVAIDFDSIAGVEYPDPDLQLSWVIPARSEQVVLELPVLGGVAAPSARYRFVYLPGDPARQPDPDYAYRAPFAAGNSFEITQTYPDSITHLTRDSMYAVDIAMPVGTDIVAARDGIVFDVASTNFKGGMDRSEYAELANFVRILHDDGSYALYAHLNWNTIRVSPGDRVRTGQYIADSGNTGFTSGPHLHFAVQRNVGMRVDSMPVNFRGPDDARIAPASGNTLTAYP